MTHSLSRLILSDGIIPDGAGDIRIAGLSGDSRKVEQGFMFAALSGVNTDGQKFLADAAARGAVAAIVAEGTPDVPGLALVRCANPRRLLALAAARFFDDQPDTTVAVTGTNGKTSVAVFVRQIWAEMGFRAASLGTIGIVGPDGVTSLSHTTPDPVELQKAVAALAKSGVEHLAIEASSHGLVQNRLDGLLISAGAFTNLTRDHLDYHKTIEDYLNAKMELFERLLPKGAPAVINADMPEAAAIRARCEVAGLVPFMVGAQGAEIRILSRVESETDQLLNYRWLTVFLTCHCHWSGRFRPPMQSWRRVWS